MLPLSTAATASFMSVVTPGMYWSLKKFKSRIKENFYIGSRTPAKLKFSDSKSSLNPTWKRVHDKHLAMTLTLIVLVSAL
jgi:hypothetical protein